MNTQTAIMELLAEQPLPVVKIASHLGISQGYIRTQLKAMEIGGLVEKVDERLPHYYRNAPTNKLVENAKLILEIKKKLVLPISDDDNPITKAIKNQKAHWNTVLPDALRNYAHAIEQLVAEGKDVETL